VLTFDKIIAEPEYESNSSKGYKCIKKGALQYPLEDGIASYWNARPIKFYSNFEYYLAQVRPWNPSEGYFFWGNNWISFLYKDASIKQPRKYNYILATNSEVSSGIWGDIINFSKNKVSCEGNTLFYFDDSSLLWNFLFKGGAPSEFKELGGENSIGLSCLFDGVPCFFRVGEAKLFSQIGAFDGDIIKSSGKSGYLVYGPYIQLDAGKYRLIAKGYLIGPRKDLGIIDIAAEGGKRILTSKLIISDENELDTIAFLDFQIYQPSNNVEFRIKVNDQTTGSFLSYELMSLKE